MPKGANKGYPQFIEAARQLIREFPDLRFSVVGNFDAEDISLDDKIRSSISFKGLLTTNELKEFFLDAGHYYFSKSPFFIASREF